MRFLTGFTRVSVVSSIRLEVGLTTAIATHNELHTTLDPKNYFIVRVHDF